MGSSTPQDQDRKGMVRMALRRSTKEGNVLKRRLRMRREMKLQAGMPARMKRESGGEGAWDGISPLSRLPLELLD